MVRSRGGAPGVLKEMNPEKKSSLHHFGIFGRLWVRDGIIRSVFLAARFKLRQAKRALTAKYIEVFTA